MNTVRSSSVGVYTHEHSQHLVLQTYETLRDKNETLTSGSNTQTGKGVTIANDTSTQYDNSDLNQFDFDQCSAELQREPNDHCGSKSRVSY